MDKNNSEMIFIQSKILIFGFYKNEVRSPL